MLFVVTPHLNTKIIFSEYQQSKASPIHTALHADKTVVLTSYYSEQHACYKKSGDIPKA
jgi:hypothetical protein